MAKGTGRKTLLDTTDLPIVHTDIEEGTIPFFIIEDNYGVAVDDYCYSLCEKKNASRTIKDENGEPDHVETYFLWNSFKYTNSFKGIIECYCEIKERKINSRKLKNAQYKDLIDTQNEIKNIIGNAFRPDGVNKEFVSFCDLVDKKEKLLSEIAEIKNIKENLIRETDSLLELIKEKRRIIVKNTEPTKHRMKLEE